MVARNKKTRYIILFLALLWLASPVFSSQAITVFDDTQHIYQLDTIPIPDQRTNGEEKIDTNLPSVGMPTVKSPNTHTDPSTLEWIMKKIAGPDFKWEHVFRGLAYGVVGGIIVVGIGVLLVQAGLVAVTAVAVGAVVSILASVAYNVITGDNGFVWWKAVGISVISGLGVITWSLMAAKAAIIWEKIRIGFTWAIERLAVTRLGQKLTALLGMIGTFFTTRLPAMIRSFGGVLKNLFSFLMGMGQKFLFYLTGTAQKSFIYIWNLIKAALINLVKLWTQGRLIWYTFLSARMLSGQIMGGFAGLFYYLIDTPEATLLGCLLAFLSGMLLDGLLTGVLSNVLSKIGKTYLGQWFQSATSALKNRVQSGLYAFRQRYIKSPAKAVKEPHKGTGIVTPAERAAAKGFPGIGTTKNGNPDFAGTEYLFPVDEGQKNIVKIKMQGSRGGDFKAANEAAGFIEAGRKSPHPDYTWHHLDKFDPETGTATMQLVRSDAHQATFPHYGSASQYDDYYGQKIYNKTKKKK